MHELKIIHWLIKLEKNDVESKRFNGAEAFTINFVSNFKQISILNSNNKLSDTLNLC